MKLNLCCFSDVEKLKGELEVKVECVNRKIMEEVPLLDLQKERDELKHKV